MTLKFLVYRSKSLGLYVIVEEHDREASAYKTLLRSGDFELHTSLKAGSYEGARRVLTFWLNRRS